MAIALDAANKPQPQPQPTPQPRQNSPTRKRDLSKKKIPQILKRMNEQ